MFGNSRTILFSSHKLCFTSIIFLHLVLQFFNQLWEAGLFPTCWKTAIVIPILKPGKNPFLMDSYRPISLLSVIGTIFEKLINTRLIWLLEDRNLLSPSQCGFRPGRSTQDQLLALSTQIQESFSLHSHLLAVFFYCSKAFDRTWHFKILNQLHSWGIRGNLPTLLRSFLSSRFFHTRVNGICSTPKILQNEVPQGSVLSPTLFCIAINDLPSILQPPIRSALFADDLAISVRCRTVELGQSLLQQAISIIDTWATNNGFQFSSTKTNAIHFCRLITCSHSLQLTINNTSIVQTSSAKYLGLWFDEKLTWKCHIYHLLRSCNARLNLLRKLSGAKFGAHRTTLLQMYNTLIRSKIDYGSSIYSAASKTLLQKLTVLENQALRIATGTLRSTPISSLHVECNQIPLNLHRRYKTITHLIQIATVENLPLSSSTSIPQTAPYVGSNFHHRVKADLADLNIRLPPTEHSYTAAVPPWADSVVIIEQHMEHLSKESSPTVVKLHFNELLQSYPNASILYTDGSRSTEAVGCAVTTEDSVIAQYALPPSFSILSAELFALYLAVDYASSSAPSNVQHLLISDSLSSLRSLANQWSRRLHPIAKKIIRLLTSLPPAKIVFAWIPGHKGIKGNKFADQNAKQAAHIFPMADTPVPRRDLQLLIHNRLIDQWQQLWTTQGHYHLRTFKLTLGPCTSEDSLSRRRQVVLTRLRVGHTLLTHSHLFQRLPRPPCPFCHSINLSVLHLLLECPDTSCVRRLTLAQFRVASFLEDSEASIAAIFAFLRLTDLTNKI